MAGRLAFSFPLSGPDDTIDVAYGGVFNVEGGSANGIFDTLEVTDLDGEVRVDGEGFSLTGEGDLNGLPADILIAQSYAPDADGNLRTEVATTLPAGQYDRLGFPEVPGLSGPLPVQIDVTLQPSGVFRLLAGINLAQARLEVEPLGFVKPPGVAGSGWVGATLQNGVVVGDVAFSVDAMDLSASGSVALDSAGNASLLDVDRLVYGATDVSVQAAFDPSGAASIDISGRQLDASSLLDETGMSDLGVDEDSSSDPPRNISIMVDRMILNERGGLNSVVGDVATDAGSVTQLSLSARQDGGGTISASFQPIGQGDALSVRTTDAGALFSLLSQSSPIGSGWFALDAISVGGTTSGQMVVENFQVRDAPELARIMAAEPVRAQVDPLDAESITFERLEAGVVFANDRLTVRDGRASGGQLGITFDGVVNFSDDTVDMRGTFVPLYGLNSLLSGVPLIGDILYGGVGGGVFAFTYRVSGAFDSLNVSVNPLSVLAPGILRRIFFEGFPPA